MEKALEKMKFLQYSNQNTMRECINITQKIVESDQSCADI